MSVLDNIILAGQEHRGTHAVAPLRRVRMPGLTAEAEQLIDFFRLTHLRDELAGSLSYGQQKLVDAAMAFMAGPSLVLLDEPAGGVNLTMLAHLKERLIAYNRRARHHLRRDRAQHGVRDERCAPASSCWRKAASSPRARRTRSASNQTVIDAYLGG